MVAVGSVVAVGTLVVACAVGGVVGRVVGGRGAGVSVVESTAAGTGVSGTRSVSKVVDVDGTVVVVVVVVVVVLLLDVVVVVVIGNDNVAFNTLSNPPQPGVPGATAPIAKFASTIVAVPPSE